MKFLSLFVVLILTLFSPRSHAEDTTGKVFETPVKVIDPVTLAADTYQIKLWGVENVDSNNPAFDLNGRTTLSNTIGGNPVRCEVKSQVEQTITAQCVNKNDLDLGLFAIQKGFATVDRTAVLDSIFEDVYLQAEAQAQKNQAGIWAQVSPSSNSGNLSADNKKNMVFLIIGFLLFLLVVGVFTFLSIVIMRGFKTVIQAQNDNLDMMAKERRLREKERAIVATMLASELKANKSKIEAYLVVYKEILSGLKDPNRKPKYQTSGDIIQAQPTLSRSVFDKNTDRMDILGRTLASDLIHFYARIKTQAEYINLEPQTDLPEALNIVQSAVDKAEKLKTIVDQLIDDFENTGLMDDDPVPEKVSRPVSAPIAKTSSYALEKP